MHIVPSYIRDICHIVEGLLFNSDSAMRLRERDEGRGHSWRRGRREKVNAFAANGALQ